MDRKYIENEHVVDRYLSGDLTVREAREFEKFCLEHPDFLNSLPIPVRLKTRLARRPVDSETGVFDAIPSSTTRAAMDANDDGFDPEEAREEMRRSSGNGASRAVVFGLLAAVLISAAAAVVYAMQANALSQQLKGVKKELTTTMQAPASVQKYSAQLVKAQPAEPTLPLGWINPPQLLDISIDVSESKLTQFQVTIDKSDGVRVMQLRRVSIDSNKELRLGLNSSAFGRGEYLVKVEGYDWRGQTELVGWVMLGL